MDNVIGESCYKGTILQRNYRKMTIKVNHVIKGNFTKELQKNDY